MNVTQVVVNIPVFAYADTFNSSSTAFVNMTNLVSVGELHGPREVTLSMEVLHKYIKAKACDCTSTYSSSSFRSGFHLLRKLYLDTHCLEWKCPVAK